jgi:peptide/nickel transport system ATP-binding protein/oligopeptide transport system ATP-binding protein
MVMYGGQIVEHATTADLFANPRHPYTRALLDSLPGRHGRDERLRSIGGQPPLLMADPDFCPFQARCAHAFERCLRGDPPLERVAPGHDVACWLDVPEGGGRRDN